MPASSWKLYVDKITGDEMVSDGFRVQDVDDIVYEVDAAMITVQDGEVDIGGNPSAEEQQEALDNGAEQVINIVHSFRLQATSFDKKSYLTYLKGYMKTIKQSLQETNPDRVPEFDALLCVLEGRPEGGEDLSDSYFFEYGFGSPLARGKCRPTVPPRRALFR